MQVSYKTQNFLDKNKDFVVAEHQALMEASAHDFSQLLFPADPAGGAVHSQGRSSPVMREPIIPRS